MIACNWSVLRPSLLVLYGALLKRLNLDALVHTRAEAAFVRIFMLPAFQVETRGSPAVPAQHGPPSHLSLSFKDITSNVLAVYITDS